MSRTNERPRTLIIGGEFYFVSREQILVDVRCPLGHAVRAIETVAGVLFLGCDVCAVVQLAAPEFRRQWFDIHEPAATATVAHPDLLPGSFS